MFTIYTCTEEGSTLQVHSSILDNEIIIFKIRHIDPANSHVHWLERLDEKKSILLFQLFKCIFLSSFDRD